MKPTSLMEGLRRIDQDPSYSAYVAASNILNKTDVRDSQMPTLKVAVLRNFTFEPVMAILKTEIARLGFYPKVYLGDYDAIAADVLSADSAFYQFEADTIILAQWLEELSPRLTQRFVSLTTKEVEEECARIISGIRHQIVNIRNQTNSPILVNNFVIPSPVSGGILDVQSQNMQVNTIRRLNQTLLMEILNLKNVYIVDYAHIMAHVGYAQGFDHRYWHAAKAPISRHALLPFGMAYARYFRAITGKTKKCLILDCDNTLWGGIIGEEGMNGIQLGPDYPGSAYQAFQNEILNLHDRGVILALCSKNNEKDVFDVLDNHPHMVLKRSHFAALQINWEDKAANIKQIVKDLNIGMDSVVFADDSAHETGLVKYQIPLITTFQLPEDPSQLSSELCRRGYFDSLTFSEEDKLRNQMYRAESTRTMMAKQAGSIEEYYTQLNMCVDFKIPEEIHIQRIAQLTQKTNQFNLTTKRYMVDDIHNFIQSADADVWCLHLKDNISDMGIVGVVIMKYKKQEALIDSFLLSCRALGRGAEDAFLSFLVNALREKGIKTLRGEYVKTVKNEQVADFFKKKAFRNIESTDAGSEWEIDLEQFDQVCPTWINMEGS